jgi:putative nucleotidyltransferase with HDIG domain
MSETLENEFLNRLFTALRKDELVLPTLPEMALKIRDIVSDPERSLGDVARAVVRDPALSARVIQIANSPVLGARARIESVELAVMRMGGAMIRNIVTALVMEQLFQATTEITDRKLRTCWKHASEVSAMAMAISHQHAHLQPDQAMLAGLIHDIGVLPVLTLAEEYPTLLRDEQQLDRLVERAHTELGKTILRHWNFPDSLVKVAAEHENLQYDSGPRADYVDLIIVANLQSSRNKAKLEQLGNLANIPAFVKLGLVEGFDSIDMGVAAGF